MRLVFVLHLVVYFASGVKLEGKAAKKIAEQKKHGKEGGKKKALMKGLALLRKAKSKRSKRNGS